jgi:hypothetical protein
MSTHDEPAVPANASDTDLSDMRVRGTVKAAGALAGMSGVVGFLTGVQFTTSFAFNEPALNVVPWGLALLGAAQAGLAILVLRNHYAGAIACAVVSALVALVAVGWTVLAWMHELISCIAICEVPLAGSAAVLAPLAVIPVKRAWLVKKRLSDSGFELGF